MTSIITILALPITPIVILACGYAVRKEIAWYVLYHHSTDNQRAMGVSLVLMAAGLAYFM